jgi:hypothetical protein
MVLLLSIGTIALAGAVVYLLLERSTLKEDLESQKLKSKAAIDYAEYLARTNEALKLELAEKTAELLRRCEIEAVKQVTKPGRPRKK